jgi:hypothetical protein
MHPPPLPIFLQSYIKAVGVGLGLDLQRLEFSSDPTLMSDSATMCSGATLRIDGKLDTVWEFSQCYLDPEHCVAVALGPPEDAIPSYLSTLSAVPPAAAVVDTPTMPSPPDLDGHLIKQQLAMPFQELTFAQLLEDATAIGSADDTP